MLSNVVCALDKGSCHTTQQPGFYSESTVSSNAFSIDVDGVGHINFPLDKATILQLLSASSQAKFGKRDKTLMDKDIRDTWEIPADKLHITVDDAIFLPMLNTMRTALGLSQQARLIPHLHNMLIYSEGQFFKEHQDSEKLEHMVASLIVVLPSPHIGGDLLIRHHDMEHRFVSENLGTDMLRCVAFYADCYHEVEKIRHGYRVALTYNLVLEQSEPAIAQYHNPDLEKALGEYFNRGEGGEYVSTRKLAYFLDHSYTEHSLNWNMLKGADSNRAHALRHTAEKLGLVSHLALVEIHESWTTEDDYDGYRRKSNHNNEDIELDELIESDTELSYWLDKNNHPLPYSACSISEDEQCWSIDTKELEPSETEHEGWMGNYGNTMDYWYRRAAVVLWDSADHVAIQFEVNYENAMDSLLQLTKTAGNERAALDMFEKSGENFYRNMGGHQDQGLSKKDYFPIFASLAAYINHADAAKRIMQRFAIAALNKHHADCLVVLEKKYGADWLLELITQWQTEDKWRSSYLSAQTLQPLLRSWLDKGADIMIIRHMLQYHINEVIRKEKECLNDKPDVLRKSLMQRLADASTLSAASFLLPDAEISRKFMMHIAQLPALYPVKALAEWLVHLHNNTISAPHQDSCMELAKYVSDAIVMELEYGVRAEDDWSIATQLPCNCQHCKTTIAFLSARNEQQKILSIVAHERDHVMSMLKGMDFPVNLSVLKKGSPHKLVMEKHKTLHNDAQKHFDELQSAYAKVRSILICVHS